MSKICQDLKCEFYEDFPDGSKFKFLNCPHCSTHLIDVHPNSVKEVTGETTEECNSKHKCEFIDIDNRRARYRLAPLGPTNNVVVTFYTAISLTHYKKINVQNICV